MTTLIVGLSTRAIAESAVRSGNQVIALDYFGDRDQRSLAAQRPAGVESYSLRRDFRLGFSAQALLQASCGLRYDELVYISNLENHPQVVEALAEGRALRGNPPSVLRRVRDWRVLRDFCRPNGLPFPATLFPGEEAQADPAAGWLVKPVLSGGGHGIHPWSGEKLTDGWLLQRRLSGRPASAAFVADGRHCVLLGVSEQLIGETDLGAAGFTWCGNLLPLAMPTGQHTSLLREIETMAAQLTAGFGLCGVNGIDLVVCKAPRRGDDQGRPFLVEVNPRFTASMELVERAYTGPAASTGGHTIFALHLDGCQGRLPDRGASPVSLAGPFWGKGIVFARREVTMPVETQDLASLRDWHRRGRRDIPHPGESIAAGHPICTVLAQGPDRDACWRQLVAAAEAVRQEIGDDPGGGA